MFTSCSINSLLVELHTVKYAVKLVAISKEMLLHLFQVPLILSLIPITTPMGYPSLMDFVD